MPEQRDAVIIGGGHNGLVTAFYLAKAGFKPLVLERSPQVGGAAVTAEIHPGFRCPILSHSAGPLRPEVVRDMQLEQHGLKFIASDVAVTALSPDGGALVLYNDEQKSAQEIAKFSQKDAKKYPEFCESLRKMASRAIVPSTALCAWTRDCRFASSAPTPESSSVKVIFNATFTFSNLPPV